HELLRQRPRLTRARVALAVPLAMALIALAFVSVAQAVPSNFVDINNHQVRWSGTGSFDWANGAASNPAACNYATNPIHCPGTNGLFDGGVFNGATTPPTPPNLIVSGSGIPAGGATFIADPLSVDTSPCPAPGPGGVVASVSGDPTVYTGTGSEKNGDLLPGDTWGNGSVPNKDEINNTYAVAHRGAGVNEIFF